MHIEEATEGDIPQITAIYNEIIASSTAVFSEDPISTDSRLRWLGAHREMGRPVVVARVNGEVAGFAAYGEFRAWPGYSSTVEHSVHVARSHRRRGIGRGLLEWLIDCARLEGLHAMVAGIDAGNEASLRLHEQLGFKQVGRMPEIARKFDRWVDLVLLQLTL
jgi:L-amino acid N-acyltransferase YncA